MYFESRRLLLCCLSLLITFFVVHEINAQDDDDVIRTTTENVVLSVTVTDQSAQYVKGLKKSNFKIFENGSEVPASAIVSFDLQESPYAAVVLLDSSGSMETRFSLARSAAIRFLDGLREEDVAAVYRFDNKVERVQEFSAGRDLAPMAYAIRAKGMTTLNDAIVEAAKVLAERPEKRRAIIILSDGMDTSSKASSDKAVESALAVGASIFAVDMSSMETPGYVKRQSAMSLKGFADKTGGRFVATPGGQALRDAFTGIAAELGQQYTISYRPLNTARDGKWRTIDVKVDREGLDIRTRRGYRAPKK